MMISRLPTAAPGPKAGSRLPNPSRYDHVANVVYESVGPPRVMIQMMSKTLSV
jgi:hypothetical protein